MANASGAIEQRNQEATCYVGGLGDERIDDDLLYELFAQVGPVVSVHMPKDKVSGLHQHYGFVEFRTEEDAEYATKVLNMVKLWGKPIRVSKASADKAKVADVGANLFIGNLAPEVDEKMLYDTFSAFGGIIQPPSIMREQETGVSKGFGFVNYDSFEASDLAIECMNGQFLANRQVVVQYAFKRDARGERHGGPAERMLAAAARRNVPTLRPHTLFAAAPGQVTSTIPLSAGLNASGGNGMPSHSLHTPFQHAMLGVVRLEQPLGVPPTAIQPAYQLNSSMQQPHIQPPVHLLALPPPPPLQQWPVPTSHAILPTAAFAMLPPPLPPPPTLPVSSIPLPE